MTINESIFAVFEGTGISSDDFPVRKRWVYNELKAARAELIKQELNKGRLLDGGTSQTFHCLTMKRADASHCFDCESGIILLRSTIPLPAMIEGDNGVFVEVYLENGMYVDPIMRSVWMSKRNRRYSLKGSYGFFPVNNYLHIVDYADVDELLVDVSSFFSHPEVIEAANRKLADCPKDQACMPVYEYEFHCPEHILRRVIEITRVTVLRKLGIPIDDDNNSKPDINVKGQAQPAG